MAAKSLAVAKYILNRQREKNDTMTAMQLIKVAYIAHGMMLGVFGRSLLDEQVEAWPYGPVVRSIYQAIAGQGALPITDVRGVPDDWYNHIDPSERKILDYVCDVYGNLPAFTLSDATHKEGTPWDTTMKNIGGYYPPISDNLIEEFYRTHVIGKPHDRL
ncbi:Panacea domain-containing protein [Neisseria sp. P0020.S005]|jgi:uncharacterized phage-associated protein-like protein|uniref:Panacea domain-containing protein n=1 Tax=Neisseria sp. P0020.S005 TaxID=3436810 RepID=UPI003F80E646